MKNIIIMGYLYRVSDRNYKKFLEAQARGETGSEFLGEHSGKTLQATDMNPEEARYLLEQLRKNDLDYIVKTLHKTMSIGEIAQVKNISIERVQKLLKRK